MTETASYDPGSPSIEVRVYRDGRLFARELCESEEDAEAVVERWSEEGNFTFTVDDLTYHHTDHDVLAPEAGEPEDDEGCPIVEARVPAQGAE